MNKLTAAQADELRGDFTREIPTRHEDQIINLSFSDSFMPDNNPVGFDSLLVQIGHKDHGPYHLAYLDLAQAQALRTALDSAIGAFQGIEVGIDMNKIQLVQDQNIGIGTDDMKVGDIFTSESSVDWNVGQWLSTWADYNVVVTAKSETGSFGSWQYRYTFQVKSLGRRAQKRQEKRG